MWSGVGYNGYHTGNGNVNDSEKSDLSQESETFSQTDSSTQEETKETEHLDLWCHIIQAEVQKRQQVKLRGGGGGVLSYKRLMGMCHWMASHIFGFWGTTVLHIYG